MAAPALTTLPPTASLGIIVDEITALAPQRQLLDPTLVAAAARAWSANTVRAFLSDLRLWDSWCRRSGVQTGSATAGTVAAYVRALSGQDLGSDAARATGERAAATIGRYLVHIGWAYRMAGRDDPTAAPLVRFEHKAARKILGVRQRQARAIRFKGDVTDLDGPPAGVCLATLLKACRKDMLGARDQALLLLAYDTGCRRSELVAIEVDHIDGPDGEGAGTLLIPRSKTDREGEGALAYLSPAAMKAIKRWREMGHIDRGALFRRVETYFDGRVRTVGEGALHPGTIAIIYKRLVRAAFDKKLLGSMSEAELERWVKAVSSHSIRVGVAQDNFAAGEGLPAIMQAYRWRDAKTVMRYGAKLAAKSGASARLAKRFSAE
ncbi:tyrosine-type recombinase/integrase [Glacieibacterium megasporae]|uniref:tyrosine-type recombinase/integrase n=1 Tax=Glacieibacterium megasporae TaxID=2835787 RepID=UPI001C1E6A61|nr:tyrosine-type recombinase/integrase [Polymorphobacter megasporae]UAJ12743.1 tyrosine-type recombinase/integrase [Polymorphobacter megasporae]